MVARGHKRATVLDAMCECYMKNLSSNDPDLLERKIKEMKALRKWEKEERKERKAHKKDKKDKKKKAAPSGASSPPAKLATNVQPASPSAAFALKS